MKVPTPEILHYVASGPRRGPLNVNQNELKGEALSHLGILIDYALRHLPLYQPEPTFLVGS